MVLDQLWHLVRMPPQSLLSSPTPLTLQPLLPPLPLPLLLQKPVLLLLPAKRHNDPGRQQQWSQQSAKSIHNLETAYQWIKQCVSLIWMYEPVWGGSQPQPWLCCGIISTPYHVTCDPKSPNLGPTWPVEWYKAAPTCPWDNISIVQTLHIHLIWLYEAVEV